MGESKNLRYCLAVPDFLGDLYICGRDSSAELALSVSQMRVGPIGLIEELGAEYIIVKNAHVQARRFLKTQERLDIERRLRDIKELGIRGWGKGQPQPNIEDYRVDSIDVDWGSYDVVICINDIIPYGVRRRHDKTLFLCMPADGILPWRFFGYDGLITQYSSLKWWRKSRLIDMPYTYLGGSTLERILDRLVCYDNDKSVKRQIFLEINTYRERPVNSIEVNDLLQILEQEGIRLGMHKEYIVQNLQEVRRSAYFVKLSGREIRGNAILEAISCGCPVLLKRELCLDHLPLPEESFIESIDDVISLMNAKDSERVREDLLCRQRSIVERHVNYALITQIENLREIIFETDESGIITKKRYGMARRVKDAIRLWCRTKGSTL